MILVLRDIDLRKQIEIERRSDYRQAKGSPPQPEVKHAAPSKRVGVPSRLHKQAHKGLVTPPDRRQNDRRRVERTNVGDRRRSGSRVPAPVQIPRQETTSTPIRHFTPRAAITKSNLRRLA
jgi:hypothetical protein